jgi:hypothetical protein
VKHALFFAEVDALAIVCLGDAHEPRGICRPSCEHMMDGTGRFSFNPLEISSPLGRIPSTTPNQHEKTTPL